MSTGTYLGADADYRKIIELDTRSDASLQQTETQVERRREDVEEAPRGSKLSRAISLAERSSFGSTNARRCAAAAAKPEITSGVPSPVLLARARDRARRVDARLGGILREKTLSRLCQPAGIAFDELLNSPVAPPAAPSPV